MHDKYSTKVKKGKLLILIVNVLKVEQKKINNLLMLIYYLLTKLTKTI